MRAQVHVNESGTLYVMPALIEKCFGPPFQPNNGGTCLLASVGSALHAMLDVPYSKLYDSYRLRTTPVGVSLKRLLGYFTKIVGPLNVYVHDSVHEVVDRVKSGIPVIVVLPYAGEIQNESDYSYGRHGIATPRHPVDPGKDGVYHTMVAIGVDVAENQLILRDSRSKYSYKGYLKVSIEDLESMPLVSRYFSLEAA